MPGVHPPNGSALQNRGLFALIPHCLPYPFSFHILAHSFALFCKQTKLNSFIFKRFRTLCEKNGGWGVMANQISDEEICPEEHRDEGPLLQAADYYPAGPEPRRAEHRDERTSVQRATEHGSRFSMAPYFVASLLRCFVTSLRHYFQ